MLFFLECLLLPVIKKPSLIGVDTDPSYVLDDLANLVFFSHFVSLMPSPPLVLPMLRIVGQDHILFFEIIKDLIRSANVPPSEYSSEFREANFARIIPDYSKLAQFHPLDLLELHTSAVLAARTATEMLPPDALAQFDYLLEVAPGINPVYQYDVFALELLCPQGLEESQTVAHPELRDCLANFLRTTRAELFEHATLDAALAFCGRTADSGIVNAAMICRIKSGILENFLDGEVERWHLEKQAASSIAVETRLSFTGLTMVMNRTSCLAQRIFCAGNKLLIRLLVKSYLFREFSEIDAQAVVFSEHPNRFRTFAKKVSDTFWKIVAARLSPIYQLRRAGYADFLDNVLFCFIVNRITVKQFVAGHHELRSFIDGILDSDRWSPLRQFGQSAPLLVIHPKLLEEGFETLSRGFASESFAEMLHLAMLTVEAVESLIPKDSRDHSQILRRVLCWIVTHGDLELFIVWNWFMAQFFPKRKKLVDIVGGLEVENWGYFEEIYNRILELAPIK